MRNEKLFVILPQNYNIMDINQYTTEAVELLKRLIATPSVSREESAAADILADFIEKCGLPARRIGNNVLVCEALDPEKPTLLLNAHIDTVAAASGYSFDPVNPPADAKRVLGLGSNDDGASVVCMIFTFTHAMKESLDLPVNLMLALSCEEERSGERGMRMLRRIVEREADFAIVGEPTEMKAAVAERGLLVVDATQGV